jgi:O-antigen/teichoic acid export membrane protein
MSSKDPSNFRSDTVWNFISFFIQAIAGAVLTLSLYFIFGSESLGVFTQLYAVFVITGQLFVLGLNDSVLKHSAQYVFDKKSVSHLALSALILSFITGIIGSFIILVGILFKGSDVFSEPVLSGIYYMLPGTILFVFNKVILGLLNGRQLFKRFAFVQSLRAGILVITILMTLGMDFYVGFIGFCFTFTEVIVLLSQTRFLKEIYLGYKAASKDSLYFKKWGITHLKFGSLSMPHGFLSESFIRIDILILALFLSDSAVGVYSFAAFFVEGIYQLPVLIRNVTNPRLVRIFNEYDRESLFVLIKKVSSLSFIVTSFIAILVLMIYSKAGSVIDIPEYETIKVIMYIIFSGLVIYSIFIPFDYAILQGGKPALQSVFMFLVVLVNVVLNFLLIPEYGLYGAAMSTSISMALAGLILSVILVLVFDVASWPRK